MNKDDTVEQNPTHIGALATTVVSQAIRRTPTAILVSVVRPAAEAWFNNTELLALGELIQRAEEAQRSGGK